MPSEGEVFVTFTENVLDELNDEVGVWTTKVLARAQGFFRCGHCSEVFDHDVFHTKLRDMPSEEDKQVLREKLGQVSPGLWIEDVPS